MATQEEIEVVADHLEERMFDPFNPSTLPDFETSAEYVIEALDNFRATQRPSEGPIVEAMAKAIATENGYNWETMTEYGFNTYRRGARAAFVTLKEMGALAAYKEKMGEK